MILTVCFVLAIAAAVIAIIAIFQSDINKKQHATAVAVLLLAIRAIVVYLLKHSL